jgi:hypothetical protein
LGSFRGEVRARRQDEMVVAAAELLVLVVYLSDSNGLLVELGRADDHMY